MSGVLLTGFAPFEGRRVNASWIAVQALGEKLASTDMLLLEIPVIWGEPRRLLEPLFDGDRPEITIALGEGRAGWFDIETRARKAPTRRLDNDGRLPGAHAWPEGPDVIDASIDAVDLQRRLMRQDIPIRMSGDAGGFICEETLYTLELLRQRSADPQTVVFVHLPPFGAPVRFNRKPTVCNEEVLRSFGHALFDAVNALHQRSNGEPERTNALR